MAGQHALVGGAVGVVGGGSVPDEPVRVFQTFSTLDLISGGRAEVMVGRGSFIESFPLFGYDLETLAPDIACL